MGCFSFMCKECGKPILSNSFRGQKVKLNLLERGKIIESMEGEYDSYGRVFDDKGEPIKWKMEWGDVCELMFDGDDVSGISAIHSKCFIMDRHTKSEDDPNQGWGDEFELFADSDPDREVT